MTSSSPTTHFIEYVRLHLLQDEQGAINQWASRFLRARDAGLVETCRHLLRGIKSASVELSTRSRAVVAHNEALLAALIDERDRADAAYRRSLHLFREAGDSTGIGWVLNDLGTLQYARGDWADAIASYREALDQLLPAYSDTSEEAMIRNNLGLALLSPGQPEAGIEELERAGDLYRQLGQPQGEARVLVNLGQLYHRRGDVSRARNVYERALEVVRSFDDRRVEVNILNSLGILHRYQGELEQSYQYRLQSLELAQEIGDVAGQAQALGNLGAVRQLQGRLDDARHYYQETLALYDMLEDRQGQAQMLGNLGHVLSLEHRSEEALDNHERALALYRAMGDTAGEVTALINTAGTHRDLDRHERADALYKEAIASARRLDNVRLLDRAIGALGTLRIKEERWDEARPLLEEALALQRRRGDRYAQVETLYKLGRVTHNQDGYEDVLATLEPAWELADEHGYGRWLVSLAWLLGDAAFAEGRSVALTHYASAAVIARRYRDERRFQTSVAILGDYVADLVTQNKRDAAVEVCETLLAIWQDDDWREVMAPAIGYFEAMIAAIRAGTPLPVDIETVSQESL